MALPNVELSLIEACIELIKQLGFPVFVAGWFMLRLEKRLEALTDAVTGREKK